MPYIRGTHSTGLELIIESKVPGTRGLKSSVSPPPSTRYCVDRGMSKTEVSSARSQNF